MPLTCFDFRNGTFVPCVLGASYPWNYTGVPVAQWLMETYPQLPVEAAQNCQQQGQALWAQTGDRQSEWGVGRSEHLKRGGASEGRGEEIRVRKIEGERKRESGGEGPIQPPPVHLPSSAPPKVLISPVTPRNTPYPIMLACLAWGFYPGDVNLTWLWNGQPVRDHLDPVQVTSNGDWTFQARLTLPVDPEKGGSYTCAVQHSSLPAPLTAEWAPLLVTSEELVGLSPTGGLRGVGAGRERESAFRGLDSIPRIPRGREGPVWRLQHSGS
uniref:Ig-like domain-containing protein n=1 Tax=Pseudonaja textilis TaxID=8673 RepID=A0A670ZHK4_PSETE